MREREREKQREGGRKRKERLMEMKRRACLSKCEMGADGQAINYVTSWCACADTTWEVSSIRNLGQDIRYVLIAASWPQHISCEEKGLEVAYNVTYITICVVPSCHHHTYNSLTDVNDCIINFFMHFLLHAIDFVNKHVPDMQFTCVTVVYLAPL